MCKPPEIFDCPLCDLLWNPQYMQHCEAELNTEYLGGIYLADTAPPPITVKEDPGVRGMKVKKKYYLCDGHHRVCAANILGKKSLKARLL
jgi:hypothetical protein